MLALLVAMAAILEPVSCKHNWIYIHINYSKLNITTMQSRIVIPMSAGFDWNLVQSFLAVLEHGSLLGAARSRKTSQPTLGRHIDELERQLGVVLFERTGRGVIPTAQALQMGETARQMEALALKLERNVTGAESSLAGTVRISASTPVSAFLLPTVIAEMRQALPDIQIELVSSNQASDLLRREADIAIRMFRPKQSSLIARKIGDVALGAYAHKSYLARRGIPRTAADLLAHDLIGNDKDDSMLRGFAAMGYPVGRDQFTLRTDDFVAQIQAVRAGIGIGFLASYAQKLDSDLKQILPGKLRIAPLPMWLAVHREIRSNVRIRAVFDHLAEALPEQI